MKTLGFYVLGFALIVFRACIFSILWGWFISPTFSIPHLSVQAATGILLIVSILRTPDVGDKTKEEVLSSAAYKSLYCLFALFLGWIVALFM
jgi:hypothetical protein